MQIGYIFREGLSGFRRAKLSTFAAVTTVCISLMLLSSFGILVLNAHRVVQSIRAKVEMEAFLADPLTADAIGALRDSIAAIPGVEDTRFISKDEAARIFNEEFGEDIHKVLDFNPLPPSIKIFLEERYRTSKGAESIYEVVKNLRGVDDVIYRKTLLEMLDRRATMLLGIVLGIGVFITISAIFLVANTIRLAIYAKRKIIQTMKLIGATPRFIRGPFVLEGLIQGFLGGCLAGALLFLTFEYAGRWLSAELSDFVSVQSYYYGIIVGIGCLLGFLGSRISIRRFIGKRVTAE